MPDTPLSGEFVLREDNSDRSEPPNNVHFYSSLSLSPAGLEFENQDKDEVIVLLVRRAIITNVPWIAVALILILIPLVISAFSNLFTPFINLSPPTQFISILLYYLTVSGFILVEFTLWYFNVGLVTNKRIIDFDVSGILYKHFSETRLNLIEDVSYSQVGTIRSVFDYGDVIIQTAGTNVNFEFDRAPNPARIVRIIADMIGGKKP